MTPTAAIQVQARTAAEIALIKAEWESVLFASQPLRTQLLRLKPDWPLNSVTVRIYRNHSFEHVASVANPWFAWWHREPTFIYSEYDDSLTFNLDKAEHVDLEVLWLDLDRYSARFNRSELLEWLSNRFTALRSLSASPIVVAMVGADEALHSEVVQVSRSLPGLRVANMLQLEAKLGERFYDLRVAKLSGTRLSDSACILVARELACHWAPACLVPRLKAVALDLDQTLYQGVLGEDGIGVRLTPGHKDLQNCLVELRKQGLFLALVSRNQPEDVTNLLARRTDFPLRPDHFSATAVGWEGKAEGIRRVAEALRIGVDSVLFVDDNPGELAAVASELPTIAPAHASADPALTKRVLEYYPALWAWESGRADELRAADLAANNERGRLIAAAPEPKDYLGSLRVTITIEVNPRQHLGRLHELSQKTNQFNLNLERFSEVELARLLDANDHHIALIGLRDRLSDSGAIGIVVARVEGEVLAIRELAVSCRALGRRLEDLMIAQAVRELQPTQGCRQIEILHRTGPRNGPARVWLSRLVAQELPPEGRVAAHDALSRIRASDYPVAIEIKHHERERA
jgi:FkbH-like protein